MQWTAEMPDVFSVNYGMMKEIGNMCWGDFFNLSQEADRL